MCVGHVETGILLTQNSLVFPGIDHFFGATEREVTQAYPYPLMPVHHFNKAAGALKVGGFSLETHSLGNRFRACVLFFNVFGVP